MTAATDEETRVGAVKAARHLTDRVGRPVTPEDVRELARTGAVTVADVWRGNDLFDVVDVDALDVDQVAAVLARPERMLTREQAVAHLGIRQADFKNLVAAAVVVPDGQTVVSLPHLSRRATTTVDLYRLEQLDEAAARADLAELWAAARVAGPRSPSPFRRLAPRVPSRAETVRTVAQHFADLWSVEVWTTYTPGPRGGWSITADTSAGTITRADADAAVERHPLLVDDVKARKVWYGDYQLYTVAESRADVRPGAAVILDTETTGLEGYIVELGVIDAATGDVLLDTLVQPGVPSEPRALEIHGITEAKLVGAPTLAEVLPRLAEAVGGRTILAYNADFDRPTLRRHAKRDGLRLGELGRAERWDCLMRRNSDHYGLEHWEALDGEHRAVGDCLAAREVLTGMTTLPPMVGRVTTHHPCTLDTAVAEEER